MLLGSGGVDYFPQNLRVGYSRGCGARVRQGCWLWTCGREEGERGAVEDGGVREGWRREKKDQGIEISQRKIFFFKKLTIHHVNTLISFTYSKLIQNQTYF